MGEKRLVEEDWNETQLEEEDSTINTWAQENVNTLYSLLHKWAQEDVFLCEHILQPAA
jgi:transposase-like protein